MKKIAVHSVPRSGSSWLGQLINSSPHVCYKFQPLFSYELKDYLNAHSSAREIEEFFDTLAVTQAAFLDQELAIEQGIAPLFEKSDITHVVYKEVRYHHILENLMKRAPDVRIVGLVRNPMAVINSWLRSPREFRSDLGWDELKEWRSAASKNDNRPENFFGFDKWVEVARLFEHLGERHPSTFLLVTYIDLLRDTEYTIEKIFEFCDLEITRQTRKFIAHSKNIDNDDVYSVYRKKQSDEAWRDQLAPAISRAISGELTGTPLEKYLR